MSDVAKELVVKIGHLQAKGETPPLADLVVSLAEHTFSTDELVSSGLSKLGTHFRSPAGRAGGRGRRARAGLAGASPCALPWS